MITDDYTPHFHGIALAHGSRENPHTTTQRVVGFTGTHKIDMYKVNRRWHSVTITPMLPGRGEDDRPANWSDWQGIDEDDFTAMVFEAMNQVLPGWIRPLELTVIHEGPAIEERDGRSKQCKNCLCAFTPKSGKALFCSPGCKMQWHRKNSNGIVTI